VFYYQNPGKLHPSKQVVDEQKSVQAISQQILSS